MSHFSLIIKHTISLFLLCLCISTQAQQLDGFFKQKPFKVSGGVGINQNVYLSNNIADRFNPYTFVATGNLNFTIYGVSLPFTFSYSNQQVNYRTPQPFNIIGVSPSYKKLTLHAGYRNMTFSPLTLSGYTYLGGGVEYSFPKLNVMAMAGRLLKATSSPKFNNALAETQNLPNYARVGAGTKLACKDKGTELSLIVFYAKDNQKSLKINTDTLAIRPEENLVYSLGFKKPLSSKITFNIEGALSGWTKNQQDNTRSENKFYEYAYLLPLKQSTVFYGAYKTGLDLALNKSTIGLNFERIGTDYRTLGTYFIASDFQNFTVNLARPLFKNKVNFSGNIGLQHDDLENKKQTKMKRVVASTNLAVKWTERINSNLSFSNFNSVINVKPVDRALLQNSIYDQIDTLNFVQINQSLNAATNINLRESDNVSKSIGISASFSQSSNNNSGVKVANKLVNGGVNFATKFKKSKSSVSLGANTNQNIYEAGTSSFYGLNSSFSKPLFKDKLSTSLSAQGNTNLENGKRVALLYGISNSYGLSLGKRHSFNLALGYNSRVSKAQSTLSSYNTTFNEFTGNFGYNFKF